MATKDGKTTTLTTSEAQGATGQGYNLDKDWPALQAVKKSGPTVTSEQYVEPRVVIVNRGAAGGAMTPGNSEAEDMEMDNDAISISSDSGSTIGKKVTTKRKIAAAIRTSEDEGTISGESVSSLNSLRSANVRKSRKVVNLAQEQWDLVQQLDQQPLEEVEARHKESMEKVIQLANTAGNLKGTYVKALRDSAVLGIAAMMSSSRRMAAGNDDEEKKAMRLKIEVLEEKVRYLQKQNAKSAKKDREEISLNRRLRRARQRSVSLSSEEETGRKSPVKANQSAIAASEKRLEERISRRMMDYFDEQFQRLSRALKPSFDGNARKASTSASGKRIPSEKRTSSEKRTPPTPKPRGIKAPANSYAIAAGASEGQKAPVQRKKEQQQQPQQQQQQKQQKKTQDQLQEPQQQQQQQQKKRTEQQRRREEEENRIELAEPLLAPDAWKTVGKKGKAVNAEAKKVAPKPAAKVNNEPKKSATKEAQKAAAAKIGRVPRTAAVTLTVPEGAMTYLEAMKKAREEVKMDELGIENVRIKRAATGAILMRIPGKEAKDKAKVLSAKLEEAFRGTGAKVGVPAKMADLRVRGIVESVTQAEIAGAIAKTGECRAEDVKVGPIRSTPRGLGTAWARCPLDAAKKIQKAKTIRVCWGPVPVEVLEKRDMQCFRCLEKGHVAAACPRNEDRSNLCFRCGKAGHKAAECEHRAYCVVCAAKGKPADHRPGGRACPPPTKREKRAEAKRTAAAAATASTASTTQQQQGSSVPKPSGGAAQCHEEAMEAEEIRNGA